MLLKEELQEIFESEFDAESWKRVLLEVFGLKRYQMKPQEVGVAPNEWDAKGYELGDFATIEGRLVGVYEVEINNAVQLQYNKVGLRNLLKPIYKNNVDAALVVFNQGKQWRFSYVSEIRVTNKETGNRETKKTDPKRYTYLFGEGQKCRTPAERFAKIQQQYNLFGGGVKLDEIEKAFSVDSLTKDFYRELSDWYFRALKEVQFPDDAERIVLSSPTDDEREKEEKTRNATSTIRLITRLIFVWFLKQKGLVSDELFDKPTIDTLINYKDKTGSTYYKAILQNLFFATLNTEMGDKNRKFVDRQYGIQGYYRYKRFFKNFERFLELTKNIPFLNGGLFENLDKNVGSEDEVRIDCFSNAKENEERLRVPDSLFFAEQTVDLSGDYGDKKKKAQKVRGLINILQGYNFTIEENTPFEIEVALDPELLGKVFENLLASYVPETETTARKMTGSFYTPREIVDYMVDEGLKCYLKQKLKDKYGVEIISENYEDKLNHLFSYKTEEPHFSPEKSEFLIHALDEVKVLDPACGSGAYPMGVLHKMVFLLNKLDKDNKVWKDLQRNKALAETEEAYKVGENEERKQRLLDINQAFEDNSDDYGRKLFLIENCIYGVDIQPIAVQIAKLRVFISLIVDQKISELKPNLGVRPLPNLETRFVAANTLITLNKPVQIPMGYDEVKNLEKKLDSERRKHFRARTSKAKENARKADLALMDQIAEKMEDLGFLNETARKVSQWNPYDQNKAATFFDKEHMFNMEEGFDIVLANPPYIRIQTLDKSLKTYFSKNYKSATKNYDLYVLFDECGINLLKPGGSLVYIQPNKFFNSDYGVGIRTLIAQNKWLNEVLDFGATQMFSSVTTYTCILHCRKNNNKQFDYIAFKKEDVTKAFIDYHYNRQKKGNIVYEQFNQDFITENAWNFGGAESIDIYTRIEAKGEPLKKLVRSIFVGLQTSADQVYILEETENGYYSKYLDETVQLEKRFLKPLLKGAEIRRYKVNFQNLWLISPYENIQGKMILIKPTAFKTKYPLTWQYLVRCEDKLKCRESGKMDHEEWYAYVYPKNLEDFNGTKIMTQVLARQASMVLDELEGYHFVGGGNAGGYGITLKENSGISYKYLLGLLNSRLLDYYLQTHSSKFQNDYFSYSKRFLEYIPVIKGQAATASKIERLVEYILYCRKTDSTPELQNIASYYEQIINAIVYEMYLPMEIKNADCEIIESLPDLFELQEVSSQPEKERALKELFQIMYDKNHRVRTVLFKLDSIEEIAIVEGKKQ